MLNKLKNNFSADEILDGCYGIEREGLRVKKDGTLSKEIHPTAFGDKSKNKYITTDFSESQIELITPVFNSIDKLYNFTNILYDITVSEMQDEFLWPQSMPSKIENIKDIKVAQYGNDEDGQKAQKYRENLLKKYGARKQLICGIHYNFSFSDKFIKKLYKKNDKNISFNEFKDNIYLKIARNYIRYRWLLIYLTGASSCLDKSYIDECKKEVKINNRCKGICCENALSYRNSECGYRNKVDLYPDYNSVQGYIESVKRYINDGVIDSPKELYSSIRIKAYDNTDFMNSLEKDGINYLEYRSIDINPFEKGGISLEDLYFMQIFNIYLLIKEEVSYKKWQEEALINTFEISRNGLKDIEILKNGNKISKKEYAIEILNEMSFINKELNLGKEEILDKMVKKIKDVSMTYAYRIHALVHEKGYVEANIELSEIYKQDAYNNRFKLYGYEDLELSTQILMKEAIKRGIEVKVIDRKENFIELKDNEKKEYIKQATKTSKDNYVSVLIMENKSVTKKVLEEHNIRVPKGKEVYSMEEFQSVYDEFENRPVVIKPKSTNFGTGISIFKDGTDKNNLKKAFEIAFKYDDTVLIEEFIRGKEYRFLVINGEVCGILHRVPANVKGDGSKSIRELVKIKNEDSLRGYHYVTPLEKINLDENAELFLKDNGKDFDYVPKKNEIIYLRENSNISTGGDSIDYTDDIPKRFKDIAVNCAEAVKANICGVDMMIEDYKDENSDYGIIELNFNPAIHIHCYPYKGKERNIGGKVLDLLEFSI